ncbi:MAG: flagellar basal body rod protein FlgB [Nitrospirae bacterium]|nr:flagellar basal body rod protein FlgB [Nitrospirota bacterium]
MDKGFGILEKMIRVANARHGVLTSNLANADTPGYKAKDIDFRKFFSKERIKLKTTDPKHAGGGGAESVKGQLTAEENPSWGDRNNVELDTEVAKMTENAMIHESAVQMMSIKIRMFRNAIRGR